MTPGASYGTQQVARVGAMLSLGALRALALAAALISYGAVPSTPTVQTEVEAQLQEELASSYKEVDYTARLRSAASKSAANLCGKSLKLSAAIRTANFRHLFGPRVSAGLMLPLRC